MNNLHHAYAVESYVGYRCSGEHLRVQAKVACTTHAGMDNLPHAIVLVPGAGYMLTLNIDVKDGLVNTAVGVLQEIEYREGNACDAVRLWIQLTSLTSATWRAPRRNR